MLYFLCQNAKSGTLPAMQLAVVGTGYVGLVSAACFAELGQTVIGEDNDEAKIAKLKRGESPIYEPGLEEVIQKGLKSGRLTFTSSLAEALPNVQMVFSAVATPPDESHKADLRAVFAVADTVGSLAEKSILFINKSTVPVGTGKKCEDRMAAKLKERGKSFAIPVISNPEFLREGMAVSDTLMPDRIVVGVNGGVGDQESVIGNLGQIPDPRSPISSAHEMMEELYRPITRVGKPLVFMTRESAEIVKYASNAFLATKISFINMLTELCEVTGADIRDVAKGMGLDNRIGPRFLHAGIGYGGSCFPKDVRALMATADEMNIPLPIVAATDSINTHQRQRFLTKILGTIKPNSIVGVWGLAFKPKTDDMRDAPSLDIVPAILKAGHKVRAFDPASMERAKNLLPGDVTYTENAMDAVTDADALVILTEWDEFRGIDLPVIKKQMKGNLVFDGRNIYEPQEVREAGFTYHGIGIGPSHSA